MAGFTVLLDACVLYPAPLRDLLVQLSTTELFRAKWTAEIHEEWVKAVLHDRPDLHRDALERTGQLMNLAVTDALIEGYRHLVPALTLPDPDDRHVLAAAIHGKCDAIVTFNQKDFPASSLASLNIEAIHPDDFISYQFDLNDAAVITSAQACKRRLKNPLKSADEYLEILRSQSLTKTVAALRPYASIL